MKKVMAQEECVLKEAVVWRSIVMERLLVVVLP